SILGHLFQGSGELCCSTAGDVNLDGVLNLADSIASLNFLFRGAFEMPGRDGRCAFWDTRQLGCAQSSCQ
ncbi:MAG: hypothetical protein AAF488_17425, partial [Planctomycetota bacterium]